MPKSELRHDVLVVPFETIGVGGAEGAPDYAKVVSSRNVVNEFPGGEPAESIEGTYLYGGRLKVHFGHVIVDTTPRLYAFDRRRHQGVIFPLLLTDEHVPSWVYDIFALFGLEADEVHIVRQPTQFEAVEFVEPGLSYHPSPQWYLDYLAGLSYRHHKDTPPDVYLGRTHIIRRGTMMGESYFGGLLDGFEYVKPEEHDISMQLSIFANAKRIVFAEGSAGYVACLLPRLDAQVYMLPRRRGNPERFGSQFVGRAQFRELGDSSRLVRLKNWRGEQHPTSPSYTLAPECIHEDMRKHGLTRHGFDFAEFQESEMRDAAQYFWNDHRRRDAQLEKIASRRSTLRASA